MIFTRDMSRQTLFSTGRQLNAGTAAPQNIPGSQMKVKQVICAAGRSGYMHRDLMAIKAGTRLDGVIFHGPTVTPGFEKIAEHIGSGS